jgi:hypothetical protein
VVANSCVFIHCLTELVDKADIAEFFTEQVTETKHGKTKLKN